jgi:hypothetical protein
MDFDTPSTSDGTTPKEKKRQLFFFGMGLYAAIFFINLIFLISYESSPSQLGDVRILAPVITVVFTIGDTAFLRAMCRKQYSQYPEVLEKWPVNIPEYPTWLYSVYLVLSFAVSAFLLSRF